MRGRGRHEQLLQHSCQLCERALPTSFAFPTHPEGGEPKRQMREHSERLTMTSSLLLPHLPCHIQRRALLPLRRLHRLGGRLWRCLLGRLRAGLVGGGEGGLLVDRGALLQLLLLIEAVHAAASHLGGLAHDDASSWYYHLTDY